MNIGETYADTRVRVTELLRGIDEAEGDKPVPTCPEWRVRDVVAHLAGACADILAGNLDGVATDAWTGKQVADRQGRTLAALLDEWTEAATQVEPLAEHFPGRAPHQWVADENTHEHDIRGALGLPGGRDSAGLAMGLDFFVTAGLASSISAKGIGPVEVVTDANRWVVGAGDGVSAGSDSGFLAGEARQAEGDPDEPAKATLTTTDFELFRALSGRRSRAQIAAYDWSVGDPTLFVEAFQYGPFTISPADIVE